MAGLLNEADVPPILGLLVFGLTHNGDGIGFDLAAATREREDAD